VTGSSVTGSSVLLVALGAAAGAPLRFIVDRWAREHTRAGTILGTLVVNVAGSFALGVVAGVPEAPGWLLPLVGVGFCGALTTFSTMQVELLKMFDAGRVGVAAGYLAGSLLAGYAGVQLASAMVRRLRLGS
jgi:fluoride exporter